MDRWTVGPRDRWTRGQQLTKRPKDLCKCVRFANDNDYDDDVDRNNDADADADADADDDVNLHSASNFWFVAFLELWSKYYGQINQFCETVINAV